MSKHFLPWDVDQISLLPPSVLDYVSVSHPAHFVRDLVRDDLDLEAVYASIGADLDPSQLEIPDQS
jgi:hypothetical protein